MTARPCRVLVFPYRYHCSLAGRPPLSPHGCQHQADPVLYSALERSPRNEGYMAKVDTMHQVRVLFARDANGGYLASVRGPRWWILRESRHRQSEGTGNRACRVKDLRGERKSAPPEGHRQGQSSEGRHPAMHPLCRSQQLETI
jgi:hypothetical protein